MPKLLSGNHIVNVAVQRVRLETRNGDENICARCHLPIEKFYVKGKLDRRNRIDTEDENEQLVSYHSDCYDLELLGHVLPVTVHVLFTMEVFPKLHL